jgi:hypothetical protein
MYREYNKKSPLEALSRYDFDKHTIVSQITKAYARCSNISIWKIDKVKAYESPRSYRTSESQQKPLYVTPCEC